MSGSGRNSRQPDNIDSSVGELRDKHRRIIVRTGLNPAVGATEEHIWGVGGLQVFPAAPGVVSLVSDDANDTIAGTGAQKVTVHGLDVLHQIITEVIDLDGLTPSVSSTSFFRVNRLQVTQVGSTGTNEGRITASIGGDPQSLIGTSDNLSHNVNYTVPGKFWLMITEISISAETGRDVSVKIGLQNPLSNSGILQINNIFIVPSNQTSFPLSPVAFVPPASDVTFRATKLSGSTGQVSVIFTGYLTDIPGINTTPITFEETF